jgi:endo-1,3(4)-beta-glucanase
MVPLMPFSPLTRSQNFVTEEWNTYFSDGKVAQAAEVQGGWKGILYANLAIINPRAAFNFFNQQDFDPSWLDGGASRTWYLAFAAGMFQATMTTCSITDIFHRSGRSTLSGG